MRPKARCPSTFHELAADGLIHVRCDRPFLHHGTHHEKNSRIEWTDEQAEPLFTRWPAEEVLTDNRTTV